MPSRACSTSACAGSLPSMRSPVLLPMFCRIRPKPPKMAPIWLDQKPTVM